MLYPSINDLLDIMENRYYLVIAVSKRARQIIDEQREGTMDSDDKPVNIATNEVAAHKIVVEKPELEMGELQDQL
ncbi:DNA-directed RNA polymerase subunit omega [Peptoclostridium litorale DSM 5388]|uniref:DNA-directed RNA polymerase subunit omega n=1 Tax=Peptoclostridium litorale DSM 5388 TaxID=1121324 RepID=A0A069RCQ7_PEPLI|nr:DNA-directed RNA polymerase subunit omega [Peptoclostridium litorale]KDR94025.1 hypothetical protein CLIT_23c02970 [Peptoclostridium litorale DSM 5388]SIN79783.1 DNA-directed RNA polymerase subunit omega [Peptoclostridium litorale DSM 5388]